MDYEKLGVNYLNIALSQTDYLVANIEYNDRTPSWDGDIEVYKRADNIHLKSDLICKIPIQVKCQKQNNLKKESVYYPVSMADINNYLYCGGTVFFVVYVSDDGKSHRIYYAELLPFDLKHILNKYGKQKTKNIELKALPESQEHISNIFLNIASDIIRQRPAINCIPVSYDDLTKDSLAGNLSIGCINISEETIYDYLFENETYLYTKLDFGLQLPVLKVPKINTVFNLVPIPVSVGNKIFYDGHYIMQQKNSLEIHIGESIKLLYQKGNEDLQFEFILKGTLSHRITDLEFFLTIIEARNFNLGNTTFPMTNIMHTIEKSSFNIPFYKDHLKYLKLLKSALDKLGVKEDLDCDNLNNNETQTLNNLIPIILDSQSICLENEAPPISYINISNLKILIIALRNEKEKNRYEYNIYGFNNIYLTIQVKCAENQNVVSMSHYTFLQQEDMIKCSNIDYKILVTQIMNFPLCDIYFKQILKLINEMLKAFDLNSKFKEQILNAVFGLITWLNRSEPYSGINILTIYHYQAIKRTRALSKEERQSLYSIIETQPIDRETYVSAYLLLDEQDVAKHHFDLMKAEQQSRFTTFAINHFWKPNT